MTGNRCRQSLQPKLDNMMRKLAWLSRGRFVINSEAELLSIKHLKRLDRWKLESKARALASPLYVGDGVALCRVMGRYKLYCTTTDIGFGAHVMMDGLWEVWLTIFMARLIQPGMAVVDVGANHGYYSLLFADLVGPKGRVAAIEPHPHTVGLLRRSVDVNGFGQRIQIFPQAVGAMDGEKVMMYLPEGEPKNAMVIKPHKHPDIPREHMHKIRSDTLSNLLSDWPKVDFLKIDVEGSEERVLEGLEPIIERDHPNILLEFNVGRCRAPEALLDRLEHHYGPFKYIDFSSSLVSVSRDDLMNRDHTEDWLLFLERP